jgi:hypothetical protein
MGGGIFLIQLLKILTMLACWFLGLFDIEGSLIPFELVNTTFKNISAGYSGTLGGVIYENAATSSNLTVERCIFSFCRGAYEGGVMYLNNQVIFSSCRFENNSATNYGYDIYKNGYCLEMRTFVDLCTTSAVDRSVYCTYVNKGAVISSCTDTIVSFFVYSFALLLIISIVFPFQIFFLPKTWCYTVGDEGTKCSDYCARYDELNAKKK